MTKQDLFAMEILIAIFVALIIYLPITIYKNWKYRREGKSFTIKYLLLIALPIMSLPFLLADDITWYQKIIIVVILGLYPVLYMWGIRTSRDSLRKWLGLPPVDIAGQIIKQNNKDGHDGS